MNEPDFDQSEAIASIAADRARVWRALIEVLSPPSPTLVDRLRSGGWTRDVRQAVKWLHEAAAPVERALDRLDGWAQRAASEEAAVTADKLSRAWTHPVDDVLELTPRIDTLSTLIEEEAAAWRRGDLDRAKALRVEEATAIDRHLVPTLPDWCLTTAEATPSPVYRIVAHLLLSWLSVESGRDFDTSLFGEQRHDAP